MNHIFPMTMIDMASIELEPVIAIKAIVDFLVTHIFSFSRI